MTAATTADKSTKQRNDMVNKMEATTQGLTNKIHAAAAARQRRSAAARKLVPVRKVRVGCQPHRQNLRENCNHKCRVCYHNRICIHNNATPGISTGASQAPWISFTIATTTTAAAAAEPGVSRRQHTI